MRTKFFTLLALCLFFCLPGEASAEFMDTAYVVISDANQEGAAGLIEYLSDSGTELVLVKPEDIASVKDKPYYIVIGAPKDDDALAAFAKESLTPRQWADARAMGKAGAVITKVGESEVLFFFSDFSLKSLINGSKDRWTETVGDWYDIPLSITQIIGY